jgi:hypothetical protein
MNPWAFWVFAYRHLGVIQLVRLDGLAINNAEIKPHLSLGIATIRTMDNIHNCCFLTKEIIPEDKPQASQIGHSSVGKKIRRFKDKLKYREFWK